MTHVYIVIENGESYESGYNTYALAVAAVKAKWDEEVNRQIEEGDGYPIESEIDVPEHASGTTRLYVEKGINILILKLSIKSSGGRRARSRRR